MVKHNIHHFGLPALHKVNFVEVAESVGRKAVWICKIRYQGFRCLLYNLMSCKINISWNRDIIVVQCWKHLSKEHLVWDQFLAVIFFRVFKNIFLSSSKYFWCQNNITIIKNVFCALLNKQITRYLIIGTDARWDLWLIHIICQGPVELWLTALDIYLCVTREQRKPSLHILLENSAASLLHVTS